MKHQFLDLLADIGFVSVTSKRRRSGEDCVALLSGSEVKKSNIPIWQHLDWVLSFIVLQSKLIFYS